MLSSLLYGIVIGSLLTVGAHCAERVCQLTGRPTRWAWVSALLLMTALMGVAPYRVRWSSNSSPDPEAATPIGADATSRKPPAIGGVAQSFEVVRREVTRPIEQTIAISEKHLAAVSLDRFLLMAWIALSTVVLLAFATAYLRIRRVRRQWPFHELHGVRVRVTPNSGPAVVGLMHPEIVVPQWLLGCPAEQQRAVLVHEHEHIRAGDPWLLATACVITAAFAWHPVVWWMASRLRLALELDCDARAIRHGFVPRIYGSILIDLTERCSGLPNSVLALADRASHLKRRLLAMRPARVRFAGVRGSIAGVFAVLFFLVGCAMQVPSRRPHINHGQSEKIDRTSADSVRTALVKLLQQRPPGQSKFFVDPKVAVRNTGAISDLLDLLECSPGAHCPALDRLAGKGSTAEDAAVRSRQANRESDDSVVVLVDGEPWKLYPTGGIAPLDQIDPDRIQQVDVFGGSKLWHATINVRTKDGWTRDLYSLSPAFIIQNPETAADLAQLSLPGLVDVVHQSKNRSLVVLVDGARREPRAGTSQLDQLNPNDIETVEVYKGGLGRTHYGRDAGEGVISMTTKAGKGGPTE